jgi:uncharacterized membrane protein
VQSDRLETFSDGVIAILITIMVLELRPPAHTDLHALRALTATFLSYVLSFVTLGIYWNNHHHLLRLTERINGSVLWANLHLLFWLSLFPFVTAWMGQHHFAQVPTATYGVVLLLAAIAYYLLQTLILKEQGPESVLAHALGSDLKGKASPAFYAVGIGLAFVNRWLALACYAFVTLLWFVPDRRLESHLQS